MKSLLLAALLCAVHAFATAQERNVVLVMNHKLDDKPFAFNTPQHAGTGGLYKMTRLQYYVSGIQLVHDGGQVMSIPDLYILVDPAAINRFALGGRNVGQIEGIRFRIGVDAAKNHADPAAYAFNHPLAPKNPSMHWGWAAGYRFVALEGFAGTTPEMLTTNFQIHAVGDDLYTPVQITTSGTIDGNDLVVTIDADYANALRGIDVAQGPVNHGSDGEALVLMQNFGSAVFSAGVTSAVKAQASMRADMHVYPNPANDYVVIESSLSDNTPVVLMDVLGREVAGATIVSGRATISLSSVPAGSYTAVASRNQNVQSVRVSVAP